MDTKFRPYKSIGLSYNAQGLVFFICHNDIIMPQKVKDLILNCCVEIAGDDYKTLYNAVRYGFDYVTLENVPAYKLHAWRAEFYNKLYYALHDLKIESALMRS